MHPGYKQEKLPPEVPLPFTHGRCTLDASCVASLFNPGTRGVVADNMAPNMEFQQTRPISVSKHQLPDQWHRLPDLMSVVRTTGSEQLIRAILEIWFACAYC